MTLDQMAAEACGHGNRTLEIERRARFKGAESRSIKSFARNICGKGIFIHVQSRQANSVDGNRVAFMNVFGNKLGFDHDARIVAMLLNAGDLPELFDDSSEHSENFEFRISNFSVQPLCSADTQR